MRRITDPDLIAQYTTDESNAFHAGDVCVVLVPENAEEVSEVLMEASASGTPVTVSGGGTGITGGRVATHGGIVLATELLREPGPRAGTEDLRITHAGAEYTVRLDRDRMLAWCPAALTLEALDNALEPGLLFPPAPTEQSAMLGGAVATDASGARSFRYGATRDWVEAIEVVLPTGERLSLARGECVAEGRALRFCADGGEPKTVVAPSYEMPATKNVAGLHAADGMDLVDLFVGCEGILGVLTEACVRLTERPELMSDLAFFGDEDSALAHADRLRAAAGELPIIAIEYFDAASLRFLADRPQVRDEHQAAVFCEIAADDFDHVEALALLVEEAEPLDDWFADSPAEREEQRLFRHALPEGINSWVRQHGSAKLGTDFAVPADAFPEMMAAYRDAADSFAHATGRDGPHSALFGHLGDYHLHLNFLVADESERALAMERYVALAQMAVSLGGTISAEHGVGKKRLPVDGRQVPYLELMYGREGLEEIARTKVTLDPAAILNLGNMIPAELARQIAGGSPPPPAN